MNEPIAGNIGNEAAAAHSAPFSYSAPVAHADHDGQFSFHERAVPAFAEEALEKLYANVMTTMARFAIYNAAPDASTYVVRRGETIETLFLFRRERDHVQVYNEQVKLDPSEISCFARRVFARYPEIKRVSLYAVDTDLAAIPYPSAKYDCLEDVVLPLPNTEREYAARLTRNTRDSIKRRHKKLLRDFPAFRFDVIGGDDVTPEQIREIVHFSEARMAAKNQSCHHSEESTDKLVRLTRRYGVVGVASIDGRICGGVVGQRVGSRHFAQVAAHDPRLDEYGLGILCNYLSICDAIQGGMAFYHFGWGRYDYKYRLLGEHQHLYKVDIYRGRREKWTDLQHVLKAAGAEKRRELKCWIARMEQGENPADKRIALALKYGREIKRRLF